VTTQLDVAVAQQALDSLITGDHHAAASRFTDDIALTGIGGCLRGHATGLEAVLERFAAIARLTHGTFGTEVEAVYTGDATHVVVVTRHWASIRGQQVHGTQALLITADGGRIRTITALSRAGSATGIWD
jgi:ketosteroid isomerase-like protein